MMKNCDPRIESYMEAVETGAVRSSKEIKALVKHVRECFETEDIYVDQQQLTDYLGLGKIFSIRAGVPVAGICHSPA